MWSDTRSSCWVHRFHRGSRRSGHVCSRSHQLLVRSSTHRKTEWRRTSTLKRTTTQIQHNDTVGWVKLRTYTSHLPQYLDSKVQCISNAPEKLCSVEKYWELTHKVHFSKFTGNGYEHWLSPKTHWGRGVTIVFGAPPSPLPTRNFVTSPQSPICHQ